MPASFDLGLRPVATTQATTAGLWPGLIGRLPKPLLVVPMVIHWFWLGLRYRSFSLPSAADPSIAIGGLAGESKKQYFDQVKAPFDNWLARTSAVTAGLGAAVQACGAIERAKLHFPLIAKPDVGWCGFGVRRIDDAGALKVYLDSYPAGETVLLQEFLDLPGEAGLFYLRWPDQQHGRLVSLTVRHPPHVVGDGTSTARELLERDPRLCNRVALYENLDRIPTSGEVVRLSTVWSHRMGGLYRNAAYAVTPALEKIIDSIACSMPNLHVARFDIRFASLATLGAGDFRILEINGAGSEAIEFFDPDVPFFMAYRGILAKQATVFAIAAQNRSRGFAPCGWRALAKAFRRQGRLIDLYPGSN